MPEEEFESLDKKRLQLRNFLQDIGIEESDRDRIMHVIELQDKEAIRRLKATLENIEEVYDMDYIIELIDKHFGELAK